VTGSAGTAVVLNHSRPADTRACLASLRRSTFPGIDVILLDTGHPDGEAEALHHEFPEVELVELGGNHGYTGNNNVGLALALRRFADWVLLLNDDVVLEPSCVATLVSALEADPRIGMAGPTVYFHDEPSIVQSAGGALARDWTARGMSAADGLDRRRPRSVAWLPGCALLVRSQLCLEVGLLDERFFTYWEDVEWCLRAARNGWKIVHVPAATVWHKGARRNELPAPAIAYYTTRNQLAAFTSLRAPPEVWCLTAIRLAATLISWSMRPMWRSRRRHRTAIWHGIVDFALGRFGRRC
jgi:GT2 family glycosyltransferase